MTKFALLITGLFIGISALANEPARRVEKGHPINVPGTVLCRDSVYQCMYKCELGGDWTCNPTRNSDPNCPVKTAVRTHWINDSEVIYDFDQAPAEMVCRVLRRAKSNVVCGNTRFGWDCWYGSLHNK